MRIPLLLAAFGKLPLRQVGGSPAGLFPPSRPSASDALLYLQDSLSSRRFLVDTGAARSVFPHRSSTPSSGPVLSAADGNVIRSWGERTLPLQFSGRRFEWTFILADVDRPILGSDFLVCHKLLVDLAGRQLVDSADMSILPLVSSNSPTSSLFTALLDVPPAYRSLLAEFPDIMGTGFSDLQPKHGVEHHIVTTGQPVFTPARRLDPDKYQAAKMEFDKMEKAGIVRRSNSPWASALHMVPKPDGSWRPCGDFRRLNNATVADKYPVPNIRDFTNRLAGSHVFSKLDLVKGYYQIPMAAADIPKTAVITPFGMYEFLVMPFGLCNAGASFQRMMDRILSGLPFVFVYLDDVLIASPDQDQHLGHLRQVLDLFRLHGLTINPSKCEFGRSQTTFLGHNVTSAGIYPMEKHVAAVKEFAAPRDKLQLQRFLGLVNFYRRFIPAAANLLLPLTSALGGSKKDFVWSSTMQSAFLRVKAAICEATILEHPVPGARLALAVDASATHVGAVFQHFRKGSWAPLSFFSRKLSPAEVKYSTFDRELLAVYLAIRHFRFMLEARPFTVFTDHRPLTQALLRVSAPWSARQQRHLAFISEFTSDLQYLPGPENVVADFLSRPPSSTINSLPALPGLDFVAVAAAQVACPDLLRLRADSKFKFVRRSVSGSSLVCDASTGILRPVLPAEFRRQAFDALHQLSHPGVRASRRLVAARFLWPGMNSDLALWARSCLDCQRAKIVRHVRPPVHVIPVPSQRFSHVHVDLVGPLRSSNGYTHLFTIIDRSTRWVEAVPMTSTTAKACADALFSSWVARFGVPAQITSDRGPQFAGSVWAQLCLLLGIKQLMTTAYHPQANGLVERFHRSLKNSLRARLASDQWFWHLPWVLLGLRVVPRDADGESAAERLYGSPLAVPGQFLASEEPPAADFLQRLRSTMADFLPPAPVHCSPPDPKVQLPAALQSARFVFVRDDAHKPPLSPLYRGPYRVVSRSAKFFRLMLGDKEDSVSVDRLKPVFSTEDVTPVQPPRRGRPPLCSERPSPVTVPVPVPPPSIPMGRGSSKEQSRPLAPSIPVPVPPPSIPMGRGSSKVQVRPLAPSKQRTYKDMLLRNLK